MRRFLLALLTAAVLLPGLALAQAAPAPGPLPTEFDAATIKPAAPPSMTGGRVMIMVGMRFSPGRLDASNMTLRGLIESAYKLKSYQVVGPDWLDGQRFDIHAETTQPLNSDQMQALLQPFLEKQFGLKFHYDTKAVPIYALVVAPGGLKMKPSSLQPPAAAPDAEPNPSPKRNHMAVGGGRGMQFMMGPTGVHVAGAATMDELTDALAGQLDRPVVNQTNLQGSYEIALNFAPTGMGLMMRGLRGLPPKPGDNGGPPQNRQEVAPAAPSLFTALPEQLGLKLDPTKGPIKRLIVDHANQQPLGN